jgi:hypothetical protein
MLLWGFRKDIHQPQKILRSPGRATGALPPHIRHPWQGKECLINQTIVDTAAFNESARNSRFVERIRLSETFYQQLLQYPVSIDPLSIIAIRNSPMAIDVYCWLAYRLLAVTEPTSISWTGLNEPRVAASLATLVTGRLAN